MNFQAAKNRRSHAFFCPHMCKQALSMNAGNRNIYVPTKRLICAVRSTHTDSQYTIPHHLQHALMSDHTHLGMGIVRNLTTLIMILNNSGFLKVTLMIEHFILHSFTQNNIEL